MRVVFLLRPGDSSSSAPAVDIGGRKRRGWYRAATVVVVSGSLGLGALWWPNGRHDESTDIDRLVVEMQNASTGMNFDVMRRLTCAQKRDTIDIGPLPDVAVLFSPDDNGIALTKELLHEQFPKASESAIREATDAIQRRDQPRFDEIFIQLLKTKNSIHVQAVDNISISGETATADVTSVYTVNDVAAAPTTKTIRFRKESGSWKYCD